MSASAVLKLQKVGFTVDQVEALADFMDTQAASKADLERGIAMVRADLADTKSEIRAEISEVKSELKADLMEVEHHLDSKISAVRADVNHLKWMGGVIVAFQVAMFVKLFIH